jgi:hypothetical protein
MSCANKAIDTVKGAFVLTPAAGKKLIGKAVAAMPQVQKAYEQGRLVVANGTTTGYVVEHLTGEELPKFNYCIGLIAEGKFAENLPADRQPIYIWKNGERVSAPLGEFIKEFEPGDVFVKGANAVDPMGHAGGLQANPNGGSWGEVMGVLTARGVSCIVPVGQEKMIPSVIEASRQLGQHKLKYTLGSPVGLCPLVFATVVTEVEALEQLCGVGVSVVAAGGIGGSEGSRSYVVTGSGAQVAKAFAIVQEVADEPRQEIGEVTTQPYRLP